MRPGSRLVAPGGQQHPHGPGQPGGAAQQLAGLAQGQVALPDGVVRVTAGPQGLVDGLAGDPVAVHGQQRQQFAGLAHPAADLLPAGGDPRRPQQVEPDRRHWAGRGAGSEAVRSGGAVRTGAAALARRRPVPGLGRAGRRGRVRDGGGRCRRAGRQGGHRARVRRGLSGAVGAGRRAP